MNNIIKIAKYTCKSLKITYIVSAAILIVGLFMGTLINNLAGIFSININGMDIIPLISIIATVNFVAHIVVFDYQISKEHGRLFFQTPIRGVELLLGNILALVAVNAVTGVLAILSVSFRRAIISETTIVAVVAILSGLTIATLIINSYNAITSVFISSTTMGVIVVIGLCIVVDLIYSAIRGIILYPLPLVTLDIGNSGIASIDIIKVLIDIIAISGLVIFAGNRIDNKVDIK